MEKEVYWSRFANNFEEMSSYVVGEVDLAILLGILSEQRHLGKTLELGCGCGTYSRVIAGEASQLLATDFSDEMVKASSKRLNGLDNISVEKQNCLDLSYDDSVFDTVLMANLLHVIPEPEKAVAEAKRVLKPGGTIIVISYTMEGMKFSHRVGMVCRYFKAWGKPSPYARTLKLATATEMLFARDFEIVQSYLVGIISKAIFITAINRKQGRGAVPASQGHKAA